MKKYIFTESQIKKIIDNQIQEQHVESYEGVIKVVNGKTVVVATSEMGNKKTYAITLKVSLPKPDGTPVYVEIQNGQAVVYGKDPKNPKGPNIKYN
jgi:ABC-type transporter MlaC component